MIRKEEDLQGSPQHRREKASIWLLIACVYEASQNIPIMFWGDIICNRQQFPVTQSLDHYIHDRRPPGPLVLENLTPLCSIKTPNNTNSKSRLSLASLLRGQNISTGRTPYIHFYPEEVASCRARNCIETVATILGRCSN